MECLIEDKLERVLRITNGNIERRAKKDESSFRWLNSSNNLKEFCLWFTEYINDENCLTANELREYEMLKSEGLVLAKEDLNRCLNEYYEAPPDTLLSFDNIYLRSAQDETQAISDRIETMMELHEQLLNDLNKTDDELINTKLSLQAAKETLADNTNSVFTLYKLHSKHLDQLEQQSSEVHNYLLQLQEQFVLEMNVDKYEQQNSLFLEALNCFIRSHFDKPSENKNRGSGEFFHLNGFIVNLEMEFKRLSKSLQSFKQEKLEVEIEVLKVNKTIAHLKKLQNELLVKKWQPTLSKMRLNTMELTYKIEDLNCNLSINRLEELKGCCHKWVELRIQKVVNNLVRAKIARKELSVRNMDYLLGILLTRDAYNLYIGILSEQEYQRVISIANFISEVWSVVANEVTCLREQKILMESNQNDYLEYMKQPKLKCNGLTMTLDDTLKSKVDDLTIATEKLHNSVKTDEINLLKQYTNQVEILNKMKNSFRDSKGVMFCGPVNKASVVDHNFYTTLQKMEEKILELAFNLRCTKMEFIKTQKIIEKDPFQRELHLFWVKFLLLTKKQLTGVVVKSELPEQD